MTQMMTEVQRQDRQYEPRHGGSQSRFKTQVKTQSWDALFEAQTYCLTLPCADDTVLECVETMMRSGNVSLRIMGEKPALVQEINRCLPAAFARYIEDLLNDYDAFMQPDILRIRLETVESRACWKWHRDYTTLRLITTLLGAGTQYLPDPSQPDNIVQCDTGEVGLFKGRLFGEYFRQEGHSACVHRSPPWEDGHDPRLLLVIDTPQDFEIEEAGI